MMSPGSKSSEHHTYLQPSWFQRRVIAAIPGADLLVARLMAALTRDSVIQIRGRRSGRMRTTLARAITVGSARYVVAIRGETQWARNLRAAGEALLRERGHVSLVRATEVRGDERRTVLAAFLASSNYAQTHRIMSEILPMAEQHPVFRIEPVSSSNPDQRRPPVG